MTEQAPLEQARTFLAELIRLMEAKVEVRAEGDRRLVLEGEESGLFIGREGHVLDALQHLVTRLRRSEAARAAVRIEVDVAGYRERREVRLRALAEETAEEVRATGRPVHLDGLSAAERRVIHLALAGAPGVRTESIGEGASRTLAVLPASSPPFDPTASR